jgi:hypothetical protein
MSVRVRIAPSTMGNLHIINIIFIAKKQLKSN